MQIPGQRFQSATRAPDDVGATGDVGDVGVPGVPYILTAHAFFSCARSRTALIMEPTANSSESAPSLYPL